MAVIVPIGVLGSRTVVGVGADGAVGATTGVLLIGAVVAVGETVGVVVVRVGSVAVGADGVMPGIAGGGVITVIGGGVTVVIGGGVTLVMPGMIGAVFAVGAGGGGGAVGCWPPAGDTPGIVIGRTPTCFCVVGGGVAAPGIVPILAVAAAAAFGNWIVGGGSAPVSMVFPPMLNAGGSTERVAVSAA